jgi:hypothetical protein
LLTVKSAYFFNVQEKPDKVNTQVKGGWVGEDAGIFCFSLHAPSPSPTLTLTPTHPQDISNAGDFTTCIGYIAIDCDYVK